MSSVSTTAEESREEIEGVIGAAARRTTFAMLLDAIVAVLVVDLAEGRSREDVVRVSDFAELLARGLVATGIIRMLAIVLSRTQSLKAQASKPQQSAK